MRPVKLGERFGAMWQVTEGLKPGDKVVVEGLLKVRPGTPVTVKEWTPPAASGLRQISCSKESLTHVRVFHQAADCRDCHRNFDDVVGAICILGLPIAQYPNIAPPEIQILTHYTGADALTIEQSVAAPIEQRMSGVDNMNYMYSINANNGDMRMIVNFDVATEPNTDQILTQLRVSQAQSQLPRT